MKPFLHLPFQKHKYRVTEGWRYSEEEQAIHDFKGHGAVDFALPRGTPVYDATNGIAISSYSCRLIKRQSKLARYKGKLVGVGLGYFVQIYHPSRKLYTAYGHLQKIAPGIAFHHPHERGHVLWPVGHKVKPAALKSYAFAAKVKKGQLIGFVGDSGLTWGYNDYLARPDPKRFPSWDEVHLHFEVFVRVGSRGKKKYFDPYGIKGVFKDYPDSYRKGARFIQNKTLWLLDEHHRPKFTR